jgi:hypothetical protein
MTSIFAELRADGRIALQISVAGETASGQTHLSIPRGGRALGLDYDEWLPLVGHRITSSDVEELRGAGTPAA